jgi:acetylornithine aminotransferase
MDLNHVFKCHEIEKTDFIRAESNTLFDKAGNPYLDFEAGCWSTVLGHNHPRINGIIENQLGKVMHLNHRYSNHLSELAAVSILEKLNIADGRCTFLSSGSEAVSLGLKISRLITGRKRFLTLANTYLAAYGEGAEQETNGWHVFDWAPCVGCKLEKCSMSCDRINQIPFEKLAGFVFEPGSASGSAQFPPGGLINTLAEAAREGGGFVFVNEVTTGIGKTGKWFGFQHYDISPDLVSVGKGLGNGYPVSAVALSRAAWQPVLEKKFRFAQSHTNDPLACAVAREVLKTVEEEGLVEQCREIGAYFLEQLGALDEKYAMVRSIRGRGLMLAMELGEAADCEAIFRQLLEKQIVVGYQPSFNVIRFFPSLTIRKSEIDHLVATLDGVLNKQMR